MRLTNCNPLIESNLIDTLANVRDQLHFLHDFAMRLGSTDMELDEHVSHGLCTTVAASINALSYEINQDDGRILKVSNELRDELTNASDAHD